MSDYRRAKVAGGTYFFTVNLADRSSDLLTRRIDLLRGAFRYARREQPFRIDAIVILPDHLHAVWTLPEGDLDFSNRWRRIKAHFSHALNRGERRSESRIAKGERGIWQRRFWEHLIRNDADYARHVDYVHINPMKHGHVRRAGDWPYSSFHRYLRAGLYPRDWTGNGDLDDAHDFGES